MKTINIWVAFIAALFFILPLSCDSSTDESSNEGQPSYYADINSFNRPTEGSPASFESTADDDYSLLIIGQKTETFDLEESSWVWANGQWTEYPIPIPNDRDNEYYLSYINTMGPTFVRNGEIVYGAYNSWFHYGIGRVGTDFTTGHKWLAFDLVNGWVIDHSRQTTGAMHGVNYIFAPDDSSIHSTTFVNFNTYNYTSITYDITFLKSLIASYPQGIPSISYSDDYFMITAFYMHPNGDGIAAGYNQQGVGRILLKTGSQWIEYPNPFGLEAGYFKNFAFSDPNNGYGIWYSNQHINDYRLFEFTTNSWIRVQPPTGCEDVFPSQIYANQGKAIVFENSSSVMLMQNGTWSCMDLTGFSDFKHAVALDDGRILIAGYKNGQQPAIVEIDGNGFREIPTPGGLMSITAVHALGDLALTNSFASTGNSIYYYYW